VNRLLDQISHRFLAYRAPILVLFDDPLSETSWMKLVLYVAVESLDYFPFNEILNANCAKEFFVA